METSIVSIPRSGFCLFILASAGFRPPGMRSFNPSVGILFVHTCGLSVHLSGFRQFQSLGRDSVCSYRHNGMVQGMGEKVSIPRSGFCLFIPGRASGIPPGRYRFNPSVGILFVHTAHLDHTYDVFRQFQSLGRDSVCSYLLSSPASRPNRTCFNPSVGILFVHTRTCKSSTRWLRWFQSLGRDSVCSYGATVSLHRQRHKSFNPSVGILFVHTKRCVFF